MKTKLYIGNLPDFVNKPALRKLFEKYGNVVEFDILSNYGFAHYGEESEAKAAQAALDGYSFDDTNIKVEISHSNVRQKAGMGGRDLCYRCGEGGHWSKECPRGPSRGRGGGRGGGGRFHPYGGRDRYDRYDSDPYEVLRDMFPPTPYERLAAMDPLYDRGYPPLPPMSRYSDYRDPYRDPLDLYARSAAASDYYRRPSLDRDPYGAPAAASRDRYMDMVERRRFTEDEFSKPSTSSRPHLPAGPQGSQQRMNNRLGPY